MPATKVVKTKPVETTTKLALVEKSKAVKMKTTNKAEAELRVPAVRPSRASSCPRCPQGNRCEGTKAQVTSKSKCERRSRSTCTAPRPAGDCPEAALRRCSPVKQPGGPSRTGDPAAPGHREQRTPRAGLQCPHQRHEAFTVIPPNPKKRKEIQKKAEAELAALEELKLSRAMAYVSINPSSVGGCMSLEEVRLKQQQEMLQARRKQVKKQVRQPVPLR
ncbi:uncharacterized protein LOC115378554 [Myripristis murdjan]|uniref:uncharacterized protein LOC115378554 n=1 Tax=Myripristis murdjan TaxID=586833 RepID=UPI00117648D8|nr:uncharacterized protein LOC115378554 [Myripristis murdjan]